MEEKAMFAAGCFWGVEAAFRQINGIIDTAVGYSGGKAGDTSYKEVCTGDTDHAEVISLSFDPNVVSYQTLLDTFWDCHDPTQLNRQGPDVGTQYRSAIYFMSADQKKWAEASRADLTASGKFTMPIVTEISKAAQFHMAEEYHQQYLEKKGLVSCHTR